MLDLLRIKIKLILMTNNISDSEPGPKRTKAKILTLTGAILCFIGGILYIFSGVFIMSSSTSMVRLIGIVFIFTSVIIIISALIGLKYPLVGGGLCVLIGILGFLPIAPLGVVFVGLHYLNALGLGILPIMGVVLTILGGIVSFFHQK